MKIRPSFPTLLLAAAAALLLSTRLAAEESTSTVAFSDPAKPGVLKVQVGRGDLHITAGETSEVTVRSDIKAVTKSARKDGLRVLTATSSFSFTEKDNVITLDALSEGGVSSGDFRITVPRSTAVIVQNSWGGDITCTGLQGDIEINSMNGQIRLEDVAGGVVVSTMNGEIKASIRELQEKKPLSFTSMNGEVLVRLPAAARANIRLRTQNGSVLTDFDETALVAKAESVAASRMKIPARPPRSPNQTEGEVGLAVREAMQEAAHAMREGAAVAKEAIRAAAEELRSQTDGTKPRPPRPPAVPTPTGGKLVSGALNGGGPEISIATMNGDVILRQLKTTR